VSETETRILDGSSSLFAANSLEEAEKIVEIYEIFNPTHTCYVGRPSPGLMVLYYLKSAHVKFGFMKI